MYEYRDAGERLRRYEIAGKMRAFIVVESRVYVSEIFSNIIVIDLVIGEDGAIRAIMLEQDNNGEYVHCAYATAENPNYQMFVNSLIYGEYRLEQVIR